MESTLSKKIQKWTEPDVATAGVDWANRLIAAEFISTGPRATHTRRLSDTIFAVVYDNRQAFAFIVEEIELEDE